MMKTLEQLCRETDVEKWVQPSFIEGYAAHLHESGTIAATSGCFDILHAGHVRSLRRAAQLATHLIVCINSDDSVRRLKGVSRPIVSLVDRIVMLNELQAVSDIIVFREDTPVDLISILKPNIWVKGGDYQHKELAERATVEKYGGVVRILPYVPGHSTTALWGRLDGSTEEHE